MTLIASVYDGDENGNQNRLNVWLKFDVWSRNEAALIFADINPESVVNDFKWATTFRGATILARDNAGDLICYGVEDDGTIVYGGTDELNHLHGYCSDLQRILAEKDQARPKEWIDIAISKKIDLPWLEWAEKRGLVGHTDALDVPTPTNRAHVSNKLAKLNQAAFRFWANADRDDRGTHPSNDDVAAWLADQAGFSSTLADKAATIIRPEWVPVGRKPEEE